MFNISDEPSSPRNLRVSEVWTDYITVAWESPETDGGSPITAYIIEKRDVMRPTWVKAGTVGPNEMSYKVNIFEGLRTINGWSIKNAWEGLSGKTHIHISVIVLKS